MTWYYFLLLSVFGVVDFFALLVGYAAMHKPSYTMDNWDAAAAVIFMFHVAAGTVATVWTVIHFIAKFW